MHSEARALQSTWETQAYLWGKIKLTEQVQALPRPPKVSPLVPSAWPRAQSKVVIRWGEKERGRKISNRHVLSSLPQIHAEVPGKERVGSFVRNCIQLRIMEMGIGKVYYYFFFSPYQREK